MPLLLLFSLPEFVVLQLSVFSFCFYYTHLCLVLAISSLYVYIAFNVSITSALSIQIYTIYALVFSSYFPFQFHFHSAAHTRLRDLTKFDRKFFICINRINVVKRFLCICLVWIKFEILESMDQFAASNPISFHFNITIYLPMHTYPIMIIPNRAFDKSTKLCNSFDV